MFTMRSQAPGDCPSSFPTSAPLSHFSVLRALPLILGYHKIVSASDTAPYTWLAPSVRSSLGSNTPSSDAQSHQLLEKRHGRPWWNIIFCALGWQKFRCLIIQSGSTGTLNHFWVGMSTGTTPLENKFALSPWSWTLTRQFHSRECHGEISAQGHQEAPTKMFSCTVQRTKGRKKIQISINRAMNRLVLHIDPTDHNSAVKMNELQLHATMWNNDTIFMGQN